MLTTHFLTCLGKPGFLAVKVVSNSGSWLFTYHFRQKLSLPSGLVGRRISKQVVALAVYLPIPQKPSVPERQIGAVGTTRHLVAAARSGRMPRFRQLPPAGGAAALRRGKTPRRPLNSGVDNNFLFCYTSIVCALGVLCPKATQYIMHPERPDAADIQPPAQPDAQKFLKQEVKK